VLRLPGEVVASAPKTNMATDDPTGQFVVTFLDILGQKDAWEGIPTSPKDANEREVLRKHLISTVEFIDMIRRSGSSFTEPSTPSEAAVNRLTGKDREDFIKMHEPPLRSQAFSDCVVLSSPLDENDQNPFPLTGLFFSFATAGTSMVYAMAGKHVLRGGIDVGSGIRMPKSNEIYGPALNCAYLLESTKADYPRVVVGKDTIKYLTTMSERQGSEPRAKVARRMAEKCLRLTSIDPDGLHILDYLGKDFLELSAAGGMGGLPYKDLFPPAMDHIQEQKESARAKGNSKLIGRYERLIDYFNSRSPLGHTI
jgi:hypothetical protein